MENVQWKAVFIALALLITAIFFKEFIEFMTFVVTDFTEAVLGNLKGGLSRRSGVAPVVRFCLTVIVIFGLIRLFRKKE